MPKKSNVPPSKCILTMGEKLTQTKYIGSVSGVSMINGVIHIINDIQTTTGMAPKVALSIVCEVFGYSIVPIDKNPTMRASVSDDTAKEDDIE